MTLKNNIVFSSSLENCREIRKKNVVFSLIHSTCKRLNTNGGFIASKYWSKLRLYTICRAEISVLHETVTQWCIHSVHQSVGGGCHPKQCSIPLSECYRRLRHNIVISPSFRELQEAMTHSVFKVPITVLQKWNQTMPSVPSVKLWRILRPSGFLGPSDTVIQSPENNVVFNPSLRLL